MAASITFWNRLEPRPRSASLETSLGACVHDALWFLTRQWQFGEFQGQDTGSPKFVEVSTAVSTLSQYRLGLDGSFEPTDASVPLERLVAAEPWRPDLFLRAELGEVFAALLEDEGIGVLAEAFRGAFPLPAEVDLDGRDLESLGFLRLCKDRVIDGYRLYQACEAAGSGLPAKPVLGDDVKAAATRALSGLRDWVHHHLGVPGTSDAPGWRADRLEYRVDLAVSAPDGRPAYLTGTLSPDGEFDWTCFDFHPSTDAPPASVTAEHLHLMPAHVQFQGMPSLRWWDFEAGSRDFGAVDVQRRDLAKLTVIDFMLVSGSDWYCLPLSQPVGTAAWIEDLVVHDVFGTRTQIKPADAGTSLPPRQRWSLYGTAVDGDPRGVASLLVIPPGPGSVILTGPVIEEVRFFRDEMAEMVWAVEHTTENAIGTPWSGHERDTAHRAQVDGPTDGEVSPTHPLIYRIETTVPEHWIPFVPVSVDPVRGDVRWERTAMVRNGEMVRPAGRILTGATTPYHIAEEEVPRTGVNLTRRVHYCRWVDGTAHSWISRTKRAGAGEGSSGLRYDLALAGKSVSPL